MRELNIEFQEQYKRLDKLCKEIYSSGEGVSAYIQEMEQTPYNERKNVYEWETIYKQLKHSRWMRNQLAHEIDIDTNFCEQYDVDWVKQFYHSILDGTDPLAQIFRTRQQITHNAPSPSSATIEQPKKSLWNRIVSKIRSWFS